MRRPIYNLRTGILTQLIFLIVAAMLLIHVVLIKLSERDLTRAKIQSGRLLIRALEGMMGPHLSRGGAPSKAGTGSPIRDQISEVLLEGGFSTLTVIDRNGNAVLVRNQTSATEPGGLLRAKKALATETWSTDFEGRIWGVLWFNNRDLLLSAPLYYEGRAVGGIHIRGSLEEIYQTLRKTEKIILLYILLDTLILALVGIYLLSGTVVKPIHALLKLTSEYKDGDLIPTPSESSGNEIGQLSRSLNHMLRRLDEGKKALKAQLVALERTNRELEQAQKEVIRSEKMASVGRLAAGIAHEIGNPIGIVLGYLELLKQGGLSEDERKDFCDRMASEITRINKIIRDLLDYSRASSTKPFEIHAHGLIRKTVKILSPQPMLEEIRLDLRLEAASDRILADPNQLQQVFLNIIMNAADAHAENSPPGDRTSEKSLIILSRNEDDTIELRFMDNGPGLSEEKCAQIFDPFFTTKDPGKGTGLGLSVSYRIIEDMGGTIRAESREGEGMTIIMTLPLYDPI